jgi:hypothetical protein
MVSAFWVGEGHPRLLAEADSILGFASTAAEEVDSPTGMGLRGRGIVVGGAWSRRRGRHACGQRGSVFPWWMQTFDL